MSLITSIAILGAVDTNISYVAKRIANHYRILLFDKNAPKLAEIYNNLLASYPFSNIEKMNCATDASWEADVVILSETYCLDGLIIEKIKQVSTGKIVVVIGEQINEEIATIDCLTLQKLLKYVKLIQVSTVISINKNEIENKLIIKGNDKAALKTINFLFTSVGFTTEYTLNTNSLP